MKKSNTQCSFRLEKRDPWVIETGPSREGLRKRPVDMAPNSPSIWAIIRILNSGRK